MLALAAGAGVGFLHVYAPQPRPIPPKPFEAYDPKPMADALSPESVRAGMDKVLALGPRFLGDPGLVRAEEHIRQAFQAAGMRVITRTLRAAAPRTIDRRILDEQGQPLPGVEVFPLLPNHFQPMVTPAAGLTGRLVLVDDQVLRTRGRFDDAIALIDANKPPETFGLCWVSYAQAGFKALVVAGRSGLDKLDWNALAGERKLVGGQPVNYVRLAANERIFQHAGQVVRLHVRQEYRNCPAGTVVGVLRAGATPATSAATPGEAEAVVICVPYDSCSMLPDRAPGVVSAGPLAATLAVAAALPAYRASLRRDVIFVAHPTQLMAHDGLTELLAVIGMNRSKGTILQSLRDQRAHHAAKIRAIDAVKGCYAREGFFADPAASLSAAAGLDATAAGLFAQQLTYVLNSLVFELSEQQLQAKVVFLHDPTESLDGAPFRQYRAAKDRYNEAITVAGYPFEKLLRTKAEFLRRWGVGERLGKRLGELRDFHAEQVAQLEAAAAIHEVFLPYKNAVVMSPMMLPGPAEAAAGSDGENVTFSMGFQVDHTYQGPVIDGVLMGAAQASDAPAGLTVTPLSPNQDNEIRPKINWLPIDPLFWNRMGYPGFALVDADRLPAYQAYGWPADLPYMHDTRRIRRSLWLFGRAVLSLAHGNGLLRPPKTGFFRGASFGGQVLASGVGSSTVPNYPLAGALVGSKGLTPAFEKPGFYEHPFVFTDPYGRYLRANSSADWIPWFDGLYSPNAVLFGPDGLIAHVKDEGPAGQDIYKSMNLSTWFQELDRINIVTFRAQPVTILDLINPQTVKAYSGVDFVTREGLAPVKRFNRFEKADDIITTFVEPDRRFFVRLKAGSVDNELVQETRAFILGVGEAEADGSKVAAAGGEKALTGPGYLAGDVPLLLDVPRRVARSMIDVNARRLALQVKYDMADARTRGFHDKSAQFLAASDAPGQPLQRKVLQARDAVAYATLDHPVLRQNIDEAVVSIVWYLCLLVPFVFFFEKLLFALTDIRKQLAVQAAAFLVVFGLLWALHPAFQMIRSSLMILLGFVILLISSGITVLFAGRFQENLDQLRTRRGIVSAAEVNVLGVVATAFMLGLNNMHRRRLRTLLTCLTLVLITFAMICFTSVHSDLVDTAVATGKASYQGVLFKNESYAKLDDSELLALRMAYGQQFRVASRISWTGVLTWERQKFNPELRIVYQPAGAPAGKKVDFKSILQFDVHEPLASHVRFLTKAGWFDAACVAAKGDACPILIPARMARELDILPEQVDAGGLRVQVNGRTFTVRAIFDDDALDRTTDLDGFGLLPFDVESMRNVRKLGDDVLGDEQQDPRIAAARTVIALANDLGLQSLHGGPRRVSVAVWMPDLRYKEARSQIENILEKSGRRMSYGLDGVAYVGQRSRQSSFAGLLDLIIPLVLAALTVLNTMRGSVYERRDEIFVYNAVGIAPRYVFFMFFAEAFVYAVVGAVAGFLLSQGTGRALTALGWTGGLTMTFTSANTIYVSLAVAGAVFASTYFPARSAAQIAAPAEEAGWQLPAPDGDEMHFLLPFTFSPRDRIAVLAFFHRYLTDHGEGSAGGFFADPPTLDVDQAAECTPHVAALIWLKPFDLGVSQELRIALQSDPETGEYIARVTLTRLSGTRQSWLRLNRSFVRLVRRQFLHWRAVRPEQRGEMFEEGQSLLRAHVLGQEPANV